MLETSVVTGIKPFFTGGQEFPHSLEVGGWKTCPSLAPVPCSGPCSGEAGSIDRRKHC